MNRLAKWYKWIMLAVICQFCGLFYINNVFLSTDITVNAKSAQTDVKKPTTGNFKISENAEKISMSFDARLGSYIKDGELHIVDVDKGKEKKVVSLGKDEITFYRWLPDRNMVIYSSDSKNGQKGVIQISTYEADNDTTRDYPEISDLPSKSQVLDIELSPYTNVVYAKIKTSETRSRIVRFNVMSQYARVMTLSADAAMKECNFTNKFVYQDKGESIYIYDGINKTKSRVPIDETNVRILDIDLNDTLFIGVLDSAGNVTQIYHQKIEDKKLTDNWTKVPLKESISPDNLVISGSGNIYINSKEENKIINIKNQLKSSYRGEFIEILDGVLVSKDSSKVYVTSMKEY